MMHKFTSETVDGVRFWSFVEDKDWRGRDVLPIDHPDRFLPGRLTGEELNIIRRRGGGKGLDNPIAGGRLSEPDKGSREHSAFQRLLKAGIIRRNVATVSGSGTGTFAIPRRVDRGDYSLTETGRSISTSLKNLRKTKAGEQRLQKQRRDRCPDGSHKDDKTGACKPI